MYLIGGNDIHRTFDDVWRIALADCVNYARTQLALRYAIKSLSTPISASIPSTPMPTPIPSTINASTCNHQINLKQVGGEVREVGEIGEEVVSSRVPQWECVHRHSSLCGGPSPRIGHTVTVIGHHLVVYGGRNIHRVIPLPTLPLSRYPCLSISTHH